MPRIKRSTEYEQFSTVVKFDSTFSKNLSALVKEKKKEIGKEQLCKELKVTRRTIELWEARQSRPDIDRLPCLAEYFNVSLDYLFGRHDHPSPDIEVQGIQEITGLDDSAIKTLKEIKEKSDSKLSEEFKEKSYDEKSKELNEKSKDKGFTLIPYTYKQKLDAINLLIKCEADGFNTFELIAAYLWHDYEALPLEEDKGIDYFKKNVRVHEKNSDKGYTFSVSILSQLYLLRIQEILISLKEKAKEATNDNKAR